MINLFKFKNNTIYQNSRYTYCSDNKITYAEKAKCTHFAYFIPAYYDSNDVPTFSHILVKVTSY